MTADYAIRQLFSLLQEFGPEHLSAIRGLSASEIDALERDIGRRLCVGHRTFMAHFGATPKCAMGMFLYNFDFSAQTLRERYRIFEEERLDPQWTFWTYLGETPMPWHLYVPSLAIEDPSIGSPVLGRIGRESMWNEVIGDAYHWLIHNRFEDGGLFGKLWDGREISLSDGKEPFDMVRALLAKLGFVLWIEMTNFQCIMRRNDSMVYFGRFGVRPDSDAWHIRMSGPDPRELRELREILADNVGAVWT